MSHNLLYQSHCGDGKNIRTHLRFLGCFLPAFRLIVNELCKWPSPARIGTIAFGVLLRRGRVALV